MSKRTLPKTSLLAYDASKELRTQHHKAIIDVLNKYPDGLIYEEISVKAGLDKHQVGRRLNELERLQIIHKPGTTKPTSTGRSAFIYKTTTIVEYSKVLVQNKLF